MGTSHDILTDSELTRGLVEEILRGLVHRMARDFLNGYPEGDHDFDAFVRERRANLALLDRLMNPPWRTPARNPAQLLEDLPLVYEIDQALDQLAAQVVIELDKPPKKPRRKRK